MLPQQPVVPFKPQPVKYPISGQPTNPTRSKSGTRPTRTKSPFKNREPICILKVELDGGDNVQHIKIYEGELPEDIVDQFGLKYNLTERAKYRLLDQINE